MSAVKHGGGSGMLLSFLFYFTSRYPARNQNPFLVLVNLKPDKRDFFSCRVFKSRIATPTGLCLVSKDFGNDGINASEVADCCLM